MWLVALLLLVNLLLIIRLWSLESSVQELSSARGTHAGHKPFLYHTVTFLCCFTRFQTFHARLIGRHVRQQPDK